MNREGHTAGDPTYPDTLTVSSTGEAADSQPVCLDIYIYTKTLGVYKKTAQTWSGRSVWQSTVRDDRFLFYNGNNL